MSGPDINRPRPLSNAIGRFRIGVSPIGSIAPFDVWDTVISQFANSEIIATLIQDFTQYVDQTKNFDDFFDLVWNIDTAQGWGLDVWGRIIGVSRVVHVPGTITYFGFHEGDGKTFGQASFYGGASGTQNFVLADGAYRTLLFAKALTNISDGSIPSINQILLNLFPKLGNCYVTDGLDMTMTYTFSFPLTDVQLAIVATSGVLPKSTGVAASIVTPDGVVG